MSSFQYIDRKMSDVRSSRKSRMDGFVHSKREKAGIKNQELRIENQKSGVLRHIRPSKQNIGTTNKLMAKSSEHEVRMLKSEERKDYLELKGIQKQMLFPFAGVADQETRMQEQEIVLKHTAEVRAEKEEQEEKEFKQSYNHVFIQPQIQRVARSVPGSLEEEVSSLAVPSSSVKVKRSFSHLFLDGVQHENYCESISQKDTDQPGIRNISHRSQEQQEHESAPLNFSQVSKFPEPSVVVKNAFSAETFLETVDNERQSGDNRQQGTDLTNEIPISLESEPQETEKREQETGGNEQDINKRQQAITLKEQRGDFPDETLALSEYEQQEIVNEIAHTEEQKGDIKEQADGRGGVLNIGADRSQVSGSVDRTAFVKFFEKRLDDIESRWPRQENGYTREWEEPIVLAPSRNESEETEEKSKSESLETAQLTRATYRPSSFAHIRESATLAPISQSEEKCRLYLAHEGHQDESVESRDESKSFSWFRRIANIPSVFSVYFSRSAENFFQLFRMLAFSRKTAVIYVCAVLTITGVLGWNMVHRGFAMKGEVLGMSTEGYASVEEAIQAINSRDFSLSEKRFSEASASFSHASELIGTWSDTVIEASRFLPVASQLASGAYLVDAAKHISDAGAILSRTGVAALALGPGSGGHGSFLETFQNIRGDIESAEVLLSQANDDLERVKVADVPEEKRAAFMELKTKLPVAVSGMRLFLDHGDIFSDILGKNGPRKFLFLFQNNQEMRATGGFIGSYAYLDMANGHVKNFFVDGIFNPDGQLRTDIVPPLPIQKISAGWSLHDSNWFPDFPVSAEKSIFFYEKTGGPTVDGVIAFTPEVLRKFLEITGPIRMDEYDVTINADNFLEMIQYQVEVAYDKEENKPKKILADLAPMLLERLFGSGASGTSIAKTLSAIEDSLSQKHILLYSRNAELESLISRAGWSGEVLPTSRDFLSVINTNINGFKTDGVVKESIEHTADIADDGTVTDTVTITRRHTGGQTGREWWDAVNADYMRVYVPLGSELLSAEGYTHETVRSPIDYDALHFVRDADVVREESGTKIDPASGTRISEDAGKTVFGNWVYVSPGEEVRVTYTYRLPFRVDPHRIEQGGYDSYSAIFEKQAGSFGSALVSNIRFPESLRVIWQSDPHLVPYGSSLILKSDLEKDRFLGMVFSSEDE